jgi:hypothetical protein
MVLVMQSKNVTGVEALKRLCSSLIVALRLLLSLLAFDHGRLPGSHQRTRKHQGKPQKALAEKEARCKEELMAVLKENGLDKEESPYGTVRIQRRAEKDYGGEIRSMEIALKEAKKLADDMGDYQTLGFKESLVYTLPKDLF